ncbi:MAG: hypothetical protein ACYS4W_04510 [Planctomycetota bacterium]|jgi:Skp family chaperone for outer membrane proteins
MVKKGTTICLAGVFLGLAGYVLFAADKPAKTSGRKKVVVGTFDSRAIAVAQFGKMLKEGYLEKLRAELKEAEAAGDTHRVKELKAKGPALQKQYHMQAFGTAPVDDLLEEVKKDIPRIARASGVDVIICVYDVVYQNPSVDFVDVTDRMVELFGPDEKTLKTIKAIQQKPPVPKQILQKMDHAHD